MVEVDNPQQAATDVVERLGLPLAWPLMEKDDYTSIGVNFGDLNIEFIRFNVRFGMSETTFSGFTGVAFVVQGSVEDAKSILEEKGLNHRIGEEAEAHTTITVEESKIFPTVFLVKYHFDTSAWMDRLKVEFQGCLGGVYKIGRLKSLEIDCQYQEVPLEGFDMKLSNRNRLEFASHSGQEPVVLDFIDNLEIVIS